MAKTIPNRIRIQVIAEYDPLFLFGSESGEMILAVKSMESLFELSCQDMAVTFIWQALSLKDSGIEIVRLKVAFVLPGNVILL